MWPLYDPSIYHPPSPTRQMTQAEFAAMLNDLSQKPDVDNVFEIVSALRGQESVRPAHMTFRRFITHRFMIFPAVAMVACVATALWRALAPGPGGQADVGRIVPELAGMAVKSSAVFPWPLLCAVLAVLLIAIRAALRDQDPVILEMRSQAAACITRMALDPKYVHEPFSSIEAGYLSKLLKGRGFDARQALDILLSVEPGSVDPDPEFRPPRRRAAE